MVVTPAAALADAGLGLGKDYLAQSRKDAKKKKGYLTQRHKGTKGLQTPFVLSLSKHRSSSTPRKVKNGPSTSSGRTELRYLGAFVPLCEILTPSAVKPAARHRKQPSSRLRVFARNEP